MNNKTIVTGVLMDEHTTISFVEVCERCHLSEAMLLEMIEHGLIRSQTKTHIDESALQRIQAAVRLQHDLDVNLPGVVLALELLDELEALRHELAVLQRHVREV